MKVSYDSLSKIRSEFPDFQVEIKISLVDEEHLSDIQLVIDSLMTTIQPIQESTITLEDTISVILVGRDQIKTYLRTFKVAHFSERRAQFVNGRWR